MYGINICQLSGAFYVTLSIKKKEVLELKRRLKKDQATFSRLVGCYVDCNHEKVCKFGGKFLTLEEDEYYKYLEISNKVLSGTLGKTCSICSFRLRRKRSEAASRFSWRFATASLMMRLCSIHTMIWSSTPTMRPGTT